MSSLYDQHTSKYKKSILTPRRQSTFGNNGAINHTRPGVSETAIKRRRKALLFYSLGDSLPITRNPVFLQQQDFLVNFTISPFHSQRPFPVPGEMGRKGPSRPKASVVTGGKTTPNPSLFPPASIGPPRYNPKPARAALPPASPRRRSPGGGGGRAGRRGEAPGQARGEGGGKAPGGSPAARGSASPGPGRAQRSVPVPPCRVPRPAGLGRRRWGAPGGGEGR